MLVVARLLYRTPRTVRQKFCAPGRRLRATRNEIRTLRGRLSAPPAPPECPKVYASGRGRYGALGVKGLVPGHRHHTIIRAILGANKQLGIVGLVYFCPG